MGFFFVVDFVARFFVVLWNVLGLFWDIFFCCVMYWDIFFLLYYVLGLFWDIFFVVLCVSCFGIFFFVVLCYGMWMCWLLVYSGILFCLEKF